MCSLSVDFVSYRHHMEILDRTAAYMLSMSLLLACVCTYLRPLQKVQLKTGFSRVLLLLAIA